MNKLSKEKRDQLILVGIGLAAVCIGIWFGLIRSQKKALEIANKKTEEVRTKIDKASSALSKSASVESELANSVQQLKTIEQSMASGDLYAWNIDTINRFIANYKVTIPSYGKEIPGEVGVIPKFPYKAATFVNKGSAYYADFGRFIADFENAYPYIRVQNLELIPSSGGVTPEEKEKLDIKFEIVVPINPNENK